MSQGPSQPVVIVGAGPAGASLALVLARQGWPVVLVEASTDPSRQFRGEALLPHGLEALAALGLKGLLQGLPRRELGGWGFALDGRPLFQVAEPLEGPGHPRCTLVSQPALLEALMQALRQTPGAHVLQGQQVNGLLRQGGRVCGVALAGGERLQASLVVACDGRQSSLRRQAGLPLRSLASPIDVLWFRLPERAGTHSGTGSDTALAADPLAGAFLTCVGREGIFSAFRSAEGEMQLGWVLDAGAPRPSLSPAEWLERMAAQSPPGLAELLRHPAAPPQEPARLRVEVGLAERWWCPGLLLLGDAAHPMSPVRAQGINLALRDACVAARVLDAVRRHSPEGMADAAALDRALPRIEALRRPETVALQRLQRREAERGLLLRNRSGLRRLLLAASPWLGPVLAHHWARSQGPLRQGLNSLETARQ